MYYDDHNPPHFHAEYNGRKVIVDIIDARVIKGFFKKVMICILPLIKSFHSMTILFTYTLKMKKLFAMM